MVTFDSTGEICSTFRTSDIDVWNEITVTFQSNDGYVEAEKNDWKMWVRGGVRPFVRCRKMEI